MHITSLTLRNFRNFKSAKLLFKDGINTIIGENGSGKTNLFYALRLLIDDSLPRYLTFNVTDFNRGIGNWVGHWIVVSIEFDNLADTEEAQALAMQAVGQMDTCEKGSLSLYFRPKYGFRKSLYEYSLVDTKDKAGLEAELHKISIADYEVVFLSRGTADFSNEETYKKLVGDFDAITFPNPDEEDSALVGARMPRELSLTGEMSCTFIKALRDVEADLKSYYNNPLLNLLKGRSKTIDIATEADIVGKVNELNTQISSLDEVQALKNGVDKSIREAVGTTYAPSIDIKSELPGDMERLMQSLKMWVGDADEDGYKGRIWEASLGGANLIYLSLKLLEYEKVKTDRIANFLLIEEPEAHLHTHIQKTLFNNLKGNKTQIIVSTHSTHISSVSKISTVNVISRGIKESMVFQPSSGLSADKVIRLERYLDAVRSNLLFAKGVILVEGDAEQILLPAMFQEVFGITLDEIGVSLVNIGSTGFENVAQIFNEKRIRKNCAILTDGDLSIYTLLEDSTGESQELKDSRASEVSGLARKALLDAYCTGNAYIKPFYATHTFEVDFLMAGNSHEIVSALPKIYSMKKYMDESQVKLESEEVSIAGAEVLRLAEKEGKGWFALTVLEELNSNTFFPDYILKAVGFAASHINIPTKIKAIEYSLRIKTENEEEFEFEINREDLLGTVEKYREQFPHDQLTRLLNSL